jgi:hypothetical protein
MVTMGYGGDGGYASPEGCGCAGGSPAIMSAPAIVPGGSMPVPQPTGDL